MTGRFICIVLTAFLALSCNILQGDDVVARVGTKRLYRSEVLKYIPAGTAPEDSTVIARQYIDSWALDLIMEREATETLSKEEKDLREELNTYRSALLKYRYEQAFLNARMRTEVTDEDVKAYYDAHSDALTLERPILKVRYLDVISDSPMKSHMLDLMSSSDYEDFSKMDSLSRIYAIRYFDSSDQWMDSMVLAREFGTDFSTMLSYKTGDWIRLQSAERLDERVAYVVDIRRKGPAPLEYCSEEIRDNILISRKQDLLRELEQDLLEEARSKKRLIIY